MSATSLFESALQAAPDAILMWDAAGRIEANWEGERPRRFKSPRSGMSGGPSRSDPVLSSVGETGYNPSQVKNLYRRAGGT